MIIFLMVSLKINGEDKDISECVGKYRASSNFWKQMLNRETKKD